MKTTLIRRLMASILPFVIIPLVLLTFFYYLFLDRVIENEVIDFHKKSLKHVGSELNKVINEPLKLDSFVEGEKVYLPELSVVGENLDVLAENFDLEYIDEAEKEYQNRVVQGYLRQAVQDQNEEIFQDKKHQRLIKPLMHNGKISALLISGYASSVKEKLILIHQAFLYFIFIIIFTAFITVVFIVILALRFMEPLDLLVNGIKRISAGDLSFNIKNSSDDEIGVVVDAFNEMTKKRQNIEVQLQESNKSLEEKVKIKTEELLKLNKSLESRINAAVKEIDEQSAVLIKQARLAQMGELISMIAHQWRQPLSSISAIAGTLKIDVMMDEYNKDFFEERLESIDDLSQHLSSTINDFRNFFKINKETDETTMQEIADGGLQIIYPTLESNSIEVLKQPNETSTRIKTYSNEVKQVVLNILKNAEDILTDYKHPDAKIWVKCYEEGAYTCLSIEDNAGGIPEEVMPKIFDPYFSTKEAKNGTGLGLYMSKTIIEDHCKGKLDVTNSEYGAKFTIKLPISFV